MSVETVQLSETVVSDLPVSSRFAGALGFSVSATDEL